MKPKMMMMMKGGWREGRRKRKRPNPFDSCCRPASTSQAVNCSSFCMTTTRYLPPSVPPSPPSASLPFSNHIAHSSCLTMDMSSSPKPNHLFIRVRIDRRRKEREGRGAQEYGRDYDAYHWIYRTWIGELFATNDLSCPLPCPARPCPALIHFLIQQWTTKGRKRRKNNLSHFLVVLVDAAYFMYRSYLRHHNNEHL